jgi:hypothetical protein
MSKVIKNNSLHNGINSNATNGASVVAYKLRAIKLASDLRRAGSC